jgi:hypothetical protein
MFELIQDCLVMLPIVHHLAQLFPQFVHDAL